MRSSLVLALLIAALTPARAQSPVRGIDGDWEGALNIPSGQLRLVVHLTKTPDGGWSGSMDSVDQGAMGLPLQEITFEGGSLKFLLKAVNGRYTGRLNDAGTEIVGEWTQGTPLPLTLRRSTKPFKLNRPQVPVKPYPYVESEVTFENKSASVTLAGTLTRPSGEGKYPAVILITGSGPQDRDESLMGHKPFLVLADHLTRAGIAVLRYDDRGAGKSSGKHSEATSEDFASDATAALDFLKVRPEIDAKRIGICGHSEGGIIGPLVAASRPDVAFLVLMAGTGVPGEAVIIEQTQAIIKASGGSDDIVQQQRASQNRILAVVREEKDQDKAVARVKEVMGGTEAAEAQARNFVTPWMRFFLTYDPAPTLAKVKCPVLAVNGELDLQVLPSQNLPPIEKALQNSGNKQFQIVRLPKLNHLFQTATTGAPNEYGKIEETMAPLAMDTITKWIRRQTGLDQ